MSHANTIIPVLLKEAASPTATASHAALMGVAVPVEPVLLRKVATIIMSAYPSQAALPIASGRDVVAMAAGEAVAYAQADTVVLMTIHVLAPAVVHQTALACSEAAMGAVVRAAPALLVKAVIKIGSALRRVGVYLNALASSAGRTNAVASVGFARLVRCAMGCQRA